MGNEFFVNGKISSKPKTSTTPARSATRPAQAAPTRSSRQQQQKTIPIIIVPSASTSAITLLNIESFLGEGMFIPSDFSKDKKAVVTFHRTKASRVPPPAPGKTIALPLTFECHESVEKFGKAEWARVVAVFTTGQAWQFGRGWGGRKPVEIFNDSEFNVIND
jgi:parafibromin